MNRVSMLNEDLKNALSSFWIFHNRVIIEAEYVACCPICYGDFNELSDKEIQEVYEVVKKELACFDQPMADYWRDEFHCPDDWEERRKLNGTA